MAVAVGVTDKIPEVKQQVATVVAVQQPILVMEYLVPPTPAVAVAVPATILAATVGQEQWFSVYPLPTILAIPV